jgi:small GTP-binding protein
MEPSNPESVEGHDYICKIVLIGDSSVGKTNLLLRLCRDVFSPNTISTVGVEYGKKKFTIENKIVNLQICDTAGQEKYKAISTSFFRNAKGALVVYDITQRSTFELVDRWIDDFRKVAPDDSFITIVGNKTDLPNRAVTKEEGQEKAKKYSNVNYIETSALLNTNVEEVFLSLATSILY